MLISKCPLRDVLVPVFVGSFDIAPGYLIHTSDTSLLDHTPNGHGRPLRLL
jgi:hypothetical protein